MSLTNIKLDNLSIRAKQAIGAITLYNYFKHKGFLIDDIKALIRHQFSVLVAQSLPTWEAEGATLPINGRGDPVPEEFLSFSSAEMNIPMQLVEFSTEIGLSAVYGEDHGESSEFLMKCVQILEVENCGAITCADLSDIAMLYSQGWGPAIDEISYRRIKESLLPEI